MEIAILIGAIVISVLVFIWLINVVKATIKTALLVAVILLILQIAFGIGPTTLWEQGLQKAWQVIQDWAPVRVIRDTLNNREPNLEIYIPSTYPPIHPSTHPLSSTEQSPYLPTNPLVSSLP